MRRLIALVIASLIVASLLSHTPASIALAGRERGSLDRARLAVDIGRIAAAARPGVLGVGLAMLGTDERWFLGGDRPFPMQSVFKAPLGAAVLDAVDRGRLRLDSTVVLRASDLSVPYSPVAAAYPSRTRWTLEELLTRAVETSDNTAADVLMRMIGGPTALTSWLQARGIAGIEVDRYERDQQPEILALGQFQASWVNQDSLDRATLAVPEPARRRAMMAYLRGRRDTMTPRGAVAFLAALQAGRLLSTTSTERLLQMMTEAVTGPHRLRAGLPEGVTLAHKTGTGPTVLGVCTATNDIGVAGLPDGRRVAIAVLLAESTADEADRDATLAAVARAAVASLRSARAAGVKAR